MEISLTSKKTRDYLLIVSKGRLSVTADLLMHATMMYREIIKYDLKKVLLEATGTIFPQSLFAYSDLVNFYVVNLPAGLRALKMAVVIKESDQKMAGYWETVCANKGFQFQVFTTLPAAESWLTIKVA